MNNLNVLKNMIARIRAFVEYTPFRTDCTCYTKQLFTFFSSRNSKSIDFKESREQF